MGELEKRTEEQQQEIEDAVLALTEAGWTQREITKELGISSKSVQPYRQRALERIPIPDHDQAVRENIVQLQYVMDECRRRLANKDMPITATNVPNLLHQFTRARGELNKVLEVGNTQKVMHGFDGTLNALLERYETSIFAGDGYTILPDEDMVDAEVIEDAEIVEDEANGDSGKNDAYEN